jgi:hypothetical protein
MALLAAGLKHSGYLQALYVFTTAVQQKKKPLA